MGRTREFNTYFFSRLSAKRRVRTSASSGSSADSIRACECKVMSDDGKSTKKSVEYRSVFELFRSEKICFAFRGFPASRWRDEEVGEDVVDSARSQVSKRREPEGEGSFSLVKELPQSRLNVTTVLAI